MMPAQQQTIGSADLFLVCVAVHFQNRVEILLFHLRPPQQAGESSLGADSPKA
jgi:hypothetical protein